MDGSSDATAVEPRSAQPVQAQLIRVILGYVGEFGFWNVAVKPSATGLAMTEIARSRILIVEDDPLLGRMLQTSFEEAGAEALWCQTDCGAYSILKLNDTRIDLLIADINLREGTTGFDVARYARSIRENMAVIYLSGEVAPGALRFGVKGARFITKPVTRCKLIEATATLLKQAPLCLS